jgi:hypothetical protein
VSSRRLGWLAILLPVLAIALAAALIATLPPGRAGRDSFHNTLAFWAMGGVPLAVLASMILSVASLLRTGRERREGEDAGYTLPVVALLLGLGASALVWGLGLVLLRGLGAR